MNFKEELVKELGLGAIAEETMLEEYVKACKAIAVRFHESEVKKLHKQNVSKRSEPFRCFEIHYPNIPANGCSVQCKECAEKEKQLNGC